MSGILEYLDSANACQTISRQISKICGVERLTGLLYDLSSHAIMQ
jgi:hypothetical protein